MRADLALGGFGQVGRRFAPLLEERRDWLSLDYDLNCRVVGIATRRHGSVFGQAGVDAVAAAVSIEGGRPLAESGAAPAGDSLDVIGRLAQSAAPPKTLGEATTPAITAGQPANAYARPSPQTARSVWAGENRPR